MNLSCTPRATSDAISGNAEKLWRSLSYFKCTPKDSRLVSWLQLLKASVQASRSCKDSSKETSRLLNHGRADAACFKCFLRACSICKWVILVGSTPGSVRSLLVHTPQSVRRANVVGAETHAAEHVKNALLQKQWTCRRFKGRCPCVWKKFTGNVRPCKTSKFVSCWMPRTWLKSRMPRCFNVGARCCCCCCYKVQDVLKNQLACKRQ